ncbi:MAG: SurA N-terminal domain-containing protein [Methylobacterium sp.]|nr:SurA N-terminal domain-containing protein [Methylobacterium sp.]MCA3652656.1 SurA N-terminal domain-containing protein [Methylobacterium sp.]MCA4921601.1 SurA N-terminal domain-containing protein [Methylobacterium sp.]
MMTAIRSAASNWLGRVVLTVVMGLLIVSFAIWGIGDIFRGGSTRNVATVGKEVITAEAYRNAFNTELQNLQRRIRRPVTTAEARAFGLDREILNRLIDEAALSAKANRLGLALDEQGVSRSVLEAEIFQTGGRFDRERYLSLLQQSGLSEPAFLRQQGEFLLRQQLFQGLVGGMTAPSTFNAALHQYREEERSLEVVAIPTAKVPEPAEPTAEALKAFHEERRAEFRTVETRQATVLTVSPQIFAGSVTLSEAELRAFYDQAVANGRFGSPERRRAFRVLFDSEAAARAAADQLAGGLTFEALLAEKNLREVDVDLGLQTRAQVADAATREAIFSLPEGGVSAPIRDPFGFVLIRVAKVEPGQATPFAEVRAEVEFDARTQKLTTDPAVRHKVDDLVKKIEDQRIAGKSLTEAGQAAGLSPLVIEGLDRNGNGPGGQRLTVPGGTETLNAIFASDIGLDNEALHLRDGSHVWFEVNRVDPARDKAFEEVEAEIRTRYLADQKSRAMGEFAIALVKRIEAGESFHSVAAELGAPVQTFSAIRRTSNDPVLGRNGVERAFASEIGKVASAVAPDGIGRLLILPKASTLLPYDAAADANSAFSRQLAQGMADDVFRQYVAALRKEAGVFINEALLAQTLGQAN